MGNKFCKVFMGGNASQIIPPGVNGPGCLREMYKKYGHECVNESLLCKWNRWTEGKFPLTGTFSVEKLSECRNIMALKAKPFKPRLFDNWEREALNRQIKEGEGKKKQNYGQGQACADRRDQPTAPRVPDLEAEIYVQQRQPAAFPKSRRRPQNYDDSLVPLYPPLSAAQPVAEPANRAPSRPSPPPPSLLVSPSPPHAHSQPLPGISPQVAKPTPARHVSPAFAPHSPGTDRPLRATRGKGVERLCYDMNGMQMVNRIGSLDDNDGDDISDECTNFITCQQAPITAFSAPIIQIPGHDGGLVRVARPWLPDEMKSVAAGLPKPEDGIDAFIEAVKRMDKIYQPTTAEAAAILSKRCLPHWLQLREKLPLDIDRTAPATPADAARNVAAQASGEDRYQHSLNELFVELRTCYTATEDWTKMAISQGKETARDFYGRVSVAVSKHGGGTTNPQQKEALIRQYFLLGGRNDMVDYIKRHLVTWSTTSPNALLQYAENFERIMETDEKNKQDEFQDAALNFYQSGTVNHGRKGGRWGNGGRSRGNWW